MPVGLLDVIERVLECRCRRILDVVNYRVWTVIDGQAKAGNPQAKIGVFVVTWLVGWVKARDTVENRPRRRKTGGRAVIDDAYAVARGGFEVVEFPALNRHSPLIEDGTGFLETAIRIQEFGADARRHQVDFPVR